jgi:SOS-response transcriptional repressor LexA
MTPRISHDGKRLPGKKRAPTENPGIFTVQTSAERLGTTVGALLGEPGYDITQSDLRTFRWIVDFFRLRFPLDGVGAVVLPDQQSFIDKAFSFPKPLVSTTIEQKGQVAAGPTPLESDFEATTAEIIGAIAGAGLFTARVTGRSMADRIRDGDTIVIDTAKRSPKQHEPVAVYVENEGGVLGYWRAEAGAYFLDKHNPDFSSVKLGPPSEWRVLGVITIVQSPISRQDRPTSRR